MNQFVKHSTFKKIWDNSTTIEKAYYVKEAKVENFVTIFTDHKYPKWNEIESNYQQKIRDAIRRIKG